MKKLLLIALFILTGVSHAQSTASFLKKADTADEISLNETG